MDMQLDQYWEKEFEKLRAEIKAISSAQAMLPPVPVTDQSVLNRLTHLERAVAACVSAVNMMSNTIRAQESYESMVRNPPARMVPAQIMPL